MIRLIVVRIQKLCRKKDQQILKNQTIQNNSRILKIYKEIEKNEPALCSDVMKQGVFNTELKNLVKQVGRESFVSASVGILNAWKNYWRKLDSNQKSDDET